MIAKREKRSYKVEIYVQKYWDEGTALSQVKQDFEKKGQKGHNVEWHYLGQ